LGRLFRIAGELRNEVCLKRDIESGEPEPMDLHPLFDTAGLSMCERKVILSEGDERVKLGTIAEDSTDFISDHLDVTLHPNVPARLDLLGDFSCEMSVYEPPFKVTLLPPGVRKGDK